MLETPRGVGYIAFVHQDGLDVTWHEPTNRPKGTVAPPGTMEEAIVPDQTGRAPDPDRSALARTMFEISPLPLVAAAIASATEWERRVYVERIARGWRWSLAHRGGAYPLLRIAARFLKLDEYHRLMIGFRTVDGHAILCRNPGHPSKPSAWRFVDFDGPASPDEVEERIRAAFGEPSLGTGAHGVQP